MYLMSKTPDVSTNIELSSISGEVGKVFLKGKDNGTIEVQGKTIGDKEEEAKLTFSISMLSVCNAMTIKQCVYCISAWVIHPYEAVGKKKKKYIGKGKQFIKAKISRLDLWYKGLSCAVFSFNILET